ncbi:hypothetical protein GCM10009623_02240 [Nocardioides aestuarii]|uniref:DUF4333 domain-containing protein n=1 Tax=Nocardioides aestuarii TaxID=252231 RepID=A0ABW4TIV6_9ACTN
MPPVQGPSSPRSRPDPGGLVIAAVLMTGVAAFVLVPMVAPRLDCSRTPVEVAADTQGLSLREVRRVVAEDHATSPGSVTVTGGGDARQLVITADDGRQRIGSVRVVRAAGDGWVVATTNTCD